MREVTFLSLLAVAAVTAGWLLRAATPPAPQNLSEVVTAARADGLNCYPSRRDGELGCRLVVSELPLTWDRAQLVTLGQPLHPGWTGTIAIYAHGAGLMPFNHDPARSVLWGNLFVYGDPVLIERLTGLRPGS